MGSVDAVVHRLEQQLRKYKEKVQERHRSSEPRRREATSNPNTEDRIGGSQLTHVPGQQRRFGRSLA